MTKKFTPFANEADVLNVGNLTIENRLDRVTLAGDIDLTLDKIGLKDARYLLTLLTDVVSELEKQDLPGKLPPAEVQSVSNPFE